LLVMDLSFSRHQEVASRANLGKETKNSHPSDVAEPMSTSVLFQPLIMSIEMKCNFSNPNWVDNSATTKCGDNVGAATGAKRAVAFRMKTFIIAASESINLRLFISSRTY
jgi:hypothetical protein